MARRLPTLSLLQRTERAGGTECWAATGVNAFYTFNTGQPFTPYQSAFSQSPNINPNDPKTYLSNCDSAFNGYFNSGFDVCRPVLANPKAPIGSVGINTGQGYMDYATPGKTIARNDVHWIYDNQYEAAALNTQYPGWGAIPCAGRIGALWMPAYTRMSG